MKSTLPIALFAIIIVIFLSAAGCGKQAVSNDRAERLAADETYRVNSQIATLTKELEQCKKQVADAKQCTALTQENQQLKNSLGEATANAKTLTEQLEQCQKELAMSSDERVKKMTEEVAKAKKDADDSVSFVMTASREETDALKAQVQKLQDELKQLKK